MAELTLPAGRALSLNAGSSSLKSARFENRKEVARHDTARLAGDDLGAATAEAIDALAADGVDVVSHRVVHGGPQLHAPAIIDGSVRAAIERALPLAPLHQAAALAVIAAAQARLPRVPHVACFDTDFHARLPELATCLPIPAAYGAQGIRRYGFHGLSYDYVTRVLAAQLGPRAVVAHLGSGSSMVALHDGTPVDTTMGLTPGGGFVMSTRSGDLDPGVVFAVLAIEEGDAGVVADALERESGLLALSGTTGDLAELVDHASHNPRARLAVDAYVLGAAKYAAAMAVTLGGLDTLVFTGGVGTNNEPVRSSIVARIAALGLAPDVLVVRTDEERMLAYLALTLIAP